MNFPGKKPSYIKLNYDMGVTTLSTCGKYYKYSNPAYGRTLFKNIGVVMQKRDSLSYSRKEGNNNMFSISLFRDKQLQLIISYYKTTNKYYIKKFNSFINISLDDNNLDAIETLKKIIPLLSDEPEDWELGQNDID